MEKTRSKIVENYYKKIDSFIENPFQLVRENLVQLIREVVVQEMEKLHLQAKPQSQSEYIDVKEAAKFLNLAVTTIYEKTSLKLIPFHKRDKKLYFKKAELVEWLLTK